jgi:hypothetical protein
MPPTEEVRRSEKHLARVLNVLLDLDQELDSFPSIQQTVVVGKGQVHHGTNLHLAVDGNGAFLDGVEAEHGGLRQVDDGSAHQGTKDAAVADGEGTTGHVLDRELAVTGLGLFVSTRATFGHTESLE